MIFVFAFHFGAQRQKLMHCLFPSYMTMVYLSELQLSEPVIEKGSESFKASKQPRQLISCPQLSTEGGLRCSEGSKISQKNIFEMI